MVSLLAKVPHVLEIGAFTPIHMATMNSALVVRNPMSAAMALLASARTPSTPSAVGLKPTPSQPNSTSSLMVTLTMS